MGRAGTIRNWASASVSIPSGSSVSGSIIHAGRPIMGILMPTAWTAASLSFDVAACPGGTLFPLYGDTGVQVAVKANACTAIAASAALDKVGPWWAFRIRSGCGVASAVDQAAGRTFVVFYQG